MPERNASAQSDRRPAPSDAQASKAWATIMQIAKENCLIVQAYGGVASLAVPEEQRKAGVRKLVLDSHLRREVE